MDNNNNNGNMCFAADDFSRRQIQQLPMYNISEMNMVTSGVGAPNGGGRRDGGNNIDRDGGYLRMDGNVRPRQNMAPQIQMTELQKDNNSVINLIQ